MLTSTATHLDDLSSGERRRLIVWAVLRTVVTVALVVVIYFLIPMDRAMDAGTVTGLVLGALAFVAVIAWQLRQIMRSGHPSIRAVEALAFSVPLYVFVFATAYFLMAHANPASFGGPMTRTDSMYFSTTVFTTVGFGDITAKSQAARVVVTVQMFLDLVILGLVARLVVNAVKMGKQRQVE
jgi:voltage-gated potassium channel